MLDVKKEVQRNDRLVEFLEKELYNVGLHTITTKNSQYLAGLGQILPFIRRVHLGSKLVLPYSRINWHCVGLLQDEHFQDYENVLPQAFADLVGVSNDLLIKGLKTGKIIYSVTVYGLLVAHNKHISIPLKYCVDFTKNAYKIEVGARDFLAINFLLWFLLAC